MKITTENDNVNINISKGEARLLRNFLSQIYPSDISCVLNDDNADETFDFLYDMECELSEVKL